MEKRGLGKGMASLIPIKKEEVVAPVAEKPFQMIPLSEIVPNPNQPRKYFDEEKIAELADSIREKGLLYPLMVSKRGGKYELVAGERRFRAATLLDLQEVPAIIRETQASESLELAIIENVQREDLDPIEEAAAYQELINQFDYTQEEVAKKMGKERATVANLLRLLKLPTKVRQALQAGQISVGHARALAGVPEIEKQLYFVDQILAEGWSVRELELRIHSKRVLGTKKKKIALKALPARLVQVVDELRRRLGTQVRIVPSGEKGKIIIEYYSDLDLDRLCQTLI